MSDQTATFDSHASPRALSSPRVWIPLTAAGAAMAAWRLRRPMVDRTERVHVEAPPDAVWDYLSDFENHWEPSNPDHAGTQVLSTPKQPLRDGLRFEQTERVGGITGDLEATLHDVIPQEQFCWRAEAVYRVAGLRLTVEEGGTVTLRETDTGTELAHRVWSRFPRSFIGKIGGLLLAAVGGIAADAAEHTRVELEYFKRHIEAQRQTQS